jgi:hypothetical protein
MINIQLEELLTLKDAAQVLPRRRRGRKPHFGTLWRWATSGLKGVKLETIRVGATLCTSREALQRFSESLTALDGQPGAQKKLRTRTPAQRKRALAQAEKTLRDAGIQ